MIDILRDPIWQGLGVIIALVLGLVGFYYAGGRNKGWLLAAASVVILIIGFALGTRTQGPGDGSVLTIEQLPREVSTFDSSDDGEGTDASEFRVFFNSDLVARYDFLYDLQSSDGAAGLQFYFPDTLDLADYQSIDFTIEFGQANESISLFLIDMADARSSILIPSTGTGAKNVSYPLSNFTEVNLHAIKTISFFSQSDQNTGHHAISFSNIRFIK